MNQPAIVAHITSVHKADDIRIRHKECRSLVQAGYDVTLISSYLGDSFDDGVRVELVPRASGRLERVLKSPLRLAAAIAKLKPDVIHFHDPELLPMGLYLALRGKRVIYDAHEDVPRQIESKHYLVAPLRRPMAWLVEALEWVAGRSFAAVVVTTPEIGKRFPEDRTVLVQNFPQRSEFTISASQNYLQRPANFAYAGGISVIRGSNEIIDAIGLLRGRNNPCLKLAGGFAPASLQQDVAKRAGWAKVDFQGWLPREAAIEMLDQCRAGLVLFHPEPNHIKAQPNKLFEYMAAGLPVIASDFPLWREIVDGARCGLLVDPLDPTAIAEAMTWILDNPEEAAAMGERGRAAVEDRFNWEAERQKLLALYAKLLPA